MGLYSWAVSKLREFFGLNKGIQEAFGVTVAVSQVMLTNQRTWRNIVAGEADWNDNDTPSLLLADAVSGEIASRVALGLKCEVSGSVRADYLNKQLKPVIDDLQRAVQAVCNGGEAIYKPYQTVDSIKVTLVETDSYWPVGYNTEHKLIDVIFGAMYQTDKLIYRLLERHKYDAEARTHSIEYKAYKAEQTAQGFSPENIGTPANLADVPDWAMLQDITIHDIDQPLFVLIKAPPTKQYEKPQRQGVPVWSKAVAMFRKADRHEARTEFEIEGGELAIHADDAMFKRGNDGELKLPKGKERVYRGVSIGGADSVAPIQVFNPEPRMRTYAQRMNDIKRNIEFLCGLSYGILSDNNMVEKTAEEFRSSKNRLVTNVSGFQQDTMQPAIEHLIESFSVLADLQGIRQGNYDTSFEWSESYAIDRQAEVLERRLLMGDGVIFPDELRAYYNETTLEQAQQDFAERGISLVVTKDEFDAST